MRTLLVISRRAIERTSPWIVLILTLTNCTAAYLLNAAWIENEAARDEVMEMTVFAATLQAAADSDKGAVRLLGPVQEGAPTFTSRREDNFEVWTWPQIASPEVTEAFIESYNRAMRARNPGERGE